MMKEWSAARERVQDVKAKNAEEGEKMSKEITSVSTSHFFSSFLHPLLRKIRIIKSFVKRRQILV